MAAGKSMHFRVNEPHVVHETIEGETILLNLGTGNYYSIEWPGTMVWNLLTETGDAEGIKNALIESASKQKKVGKTLDAFFNTLLEEELVVPAENGHAKSMVLDEETGNEFKKAVNQLEKLSLNKYSDMKDMLLLDPIHDVDEKGWPEPKKDD